MFKNKQHYTFIALLLFVAGVYMVGASKIIETCDYWWHIKAGEYIVNNARIPTSDIFSWYGLENNLNWTSHEWLSEVLLYIPYKIFGVSGGYIVAFTLFLLTGILMYLLNRKSYEKNLVFSLVWLLFGVLILMPTFNPRPHMFSFILFLITFKIIYNFIQKEADKTIWLIPIISILWVNLHGGSSNLPYILCLIAFFTGLIKREYNFIKFERLSRKKLETLLFVSVISTISLTLNPHGAEMILYPYINMGDTLMLNVIQEWRAPDFKVLGDYPIYMLIFAIYFIFLKRIRKVKALDFAYVLVFTALTFKSIRFSPFLYAVSTYIIFEYIEDKKWDSKVFATGTILLSILFIFMSIPSIKNSYHNFKSLQPLDLAIVNEIKKNDFKKIYNSYDLGGYLIYNDIKPFIDGRADMYSNNILREYHVISEMILDATQLIEKHDFDAFVVENGSAIDNYIKNNSSYIKLLSDKNYNLYKKIEA